MQGIKAIKALVAFMGVLLVAGLAVLGWGLSNTAGKVGKPRPAATVSDASDFGAVVVPVPAGSRIEQTLVAGERVVVRLSGGGDRLLVLDPATGRVAGSFVLTPEAPAGR
ncbi:hypothetical protein [Magnetospirillum aberrantis]|uniref:Uncharacterized protein n=1 Tax=Magnetospirillum aberrantis SpK TaxID=908842 RepID=A0A7C9QVG2_9PROT|nr:hypothetical protein [Magnetospirillum aberrantis]NFV80296.1 hypothetical protein [Magnetospirillum aberrantis SpK]